MIASPSPGAIRPTARDNAKAALRISEGFNMESKHNRLIGYLVYDAQKHITKSLEVTLKPYDITPGQWNLINQLDQAGELSQKELATITHKEQATITRYLDTLERKGLVVRNKHKTDRRSHVVSTGAAPYRHHGKPPDRGHRSAGYRHVRDGAGRPQGKRRGHIRGVSSSLAASAPMGAPLRRRPSPASRSMRERLP